MHRLQERAATRIYEEAIADRPPARRARRVALVVLAGVVHAATLALVVAAVGLLVARGIVFWTVLVALLLFWLAWSMRPRPPKRPLRPVHAAAKDAPALHSLVRRVAAAAGYDRAIRIELTDDVNASVHRSRHGTVLWLGVPFWLVLRPEERIAVVGHELGHLVSGDPLRGRFVAGALQALERWYAVFIPSEVVTIGMLFARPFFWLARTIIRGVAATIVRLAFLDSQRAEYRADELGARVASSHASVSALGSGGIAPWVEGQLRSPSRAGLFDRAAAVANAVDGDERDRLLRSARSNRHAATATTHPPTGLRIAAIEARAPVPGTVRASPEELVAIDAELRALSAELDRRQQRLDFKLGKHLYPTER